MSPEVARAMSTGATTAALLPVPFPTGGMVAVGYEYYSKGRLPQMSEWKDVTAMCLAGMAGAIGVQIVSDSTPLGIVMPVFPQVPRLLGM